MLYITDEVLRDLSVLIGMHPPERGGALLGLPGRPFVTRFVFDVHAETTGATYKPSPDLNTLVQEAERVEGLELQGILHSHPAGLDRPSWQDAQEFEVGLALNPHMPFYLAPIVTHRSLPQPPLQPHEVLLAGAKVSFYAAYRRPRLRPQAPRMACVAPRHPRAGVEVQPLPVQVVPMARDLRRVCAKFGGDRIQDVGITEVDGRDLLTRRVVLAGGLECLFFFSENYPHRPPLLLVTTAGAPLEQVALPWPGQCPADDRLLEVLSSVLTPGGRYGKHYGVICRNQARGASAPPARLTSLVRTFFWGRSRAQR